MLFLTNLLANVGWYEEFETNRRKRHLEIAYRIKPVGQTFRLCAIGRTVNLAYGIEFVCEVNLYRLA